MPNALRTTVLALLIFCGVVTSAQAQFTQQQLSTEREVRSVRIFVDQCRNDHTACAFYLSGVLDGVMLSEALASTPYSYCTRGASYPEITDGYLSFINVEQVRGNVG
jgi:hypothetical protein